LEFENSLPSFLPVKSYFLLEEFIDEPADDEDIFDQDEMYYV